MGKQYIQKTNRQQKVKSTYTKKTTVHWTFPLTKNDLIFIAIGIGIIILGYILMATGITEEPALPNGKWNNPFAVTIAPILLIIGYCVVIPLAILRLFKRPKDN